MNTKYQIFMFYENVYLLHSAVCVVYSDCANICEPGWKGFFVCL